MYRLLILFALTSLVVGCDSSSNPIETTGTVSGYVRLVDSVGNFILDKSGVTVSLESDTTRNTQTDSTGHWSLSDLDAGTYVLDFTKSGFGRSKIVGYQFVGDDSAYTSRVTLSQRPPDSITHLMVEVDSLFIGYDGRISRRLIPCNILIAIDNDSSLLSNDPTKAAYLQTFGTNGSLDSGGFGEAPTRIADVLGAGVARGQAFLSLSILSEGQGNSYGYYGRYFDPRLNRTIYTALGKQSKIVEFKF